MSATNSTPNINLPLFVGTDKPAWLVDFNGAMNSIDSAVGTNTTNIAGNSSAIATLNNSVSSLGTTVGQHTTSIQTLTTATTHNAGDISTINSLIGNGTPTTTDKTLVGAINEIYADITGGGTDIEADNVTYDNTSSGLSATDVQSAIDELAGGGQVVLEEKVVGTLAQGSTSITLSLTTQTISATTLVLWFTAEYGVNPTNVTTTSNSVTLTFNAQDHAVAVGVLVKN